MTVTEKPYEHSVYRAFAASTFGAPTCNYMFGTLFKSSAVNRNVQACPDRWNDVVGDDHAHHEPRESGSTLPHADSPQRLAQLLAGLGTDEEEMQHEVLKRSKGWERHGRGWGLGARD